MNETFVASLVAAVVCTVVGISVLVVMMKKWSQPYAEILNLATWFFFSMVPPLVLFAIDAKSSAGGEIRGFTVAGAFSAYALTWVLATRWTSAAHQRAMERRDEGLAKRNMELEQQVANVRESNTLIASNSHEFSVVDSDGKIICVLEGAIENVRDVDLWVNSENTNMQMARFYDKSVSGAIRYYGASKDGEEIEDTIFDDLRRQMGRKTSVDAGRVLVTSAGELADRNNVRQILHVASVQGVPTRGYVQVPNLQACVDNVLSKADDLNDSVDGRKHTSIVFPLLGAGTAGANLKKTAITLLMAAASRLHNNKDSRIERVCFITPTDAERDMCLRALTGALDDEQARNLAKMVKPR